MKKKSKIMKYVKDYFIITLASVLYSVGFCWFYQPNGISVGGFTGISQIINYLMPAIPIGISTFVLNIPCFIIGAKIQGAKAMIPSLYCMTACSLFVDLINKIYTFTPINDVLLASVFGGVTAGIACGLQMRVGATNGGSELTARLLKYKFKHISVGRLCMYVDICVIILYSIVFKRISSALYGVISMYVLSLAVDTVVYGGTHAKMAYIISNENEKIRKVLLDMNLGLTVVDSHGGLYDDEKKMIMCVVKVRQIAAIKAAVNEIDPRAFVIVCDAHEVLGEGFGTYSPDEL